jgi:hypothetical protein
MDRYINKKTGKVYIMVNESIINTTNDRDGEEMVLYVSLEDTGTQTSSLRFVRNKQEFLKKFKYDGTHIPV